MAKLTLNIQPDFEFDLLAIASPLRDYRLAYFINKHTTLTLERTPDIELNDPKSRSQAWYCRYQYYDYMDRIVFYLLGNHSITGNQYLLPELKQFDYLLMAKGDCSQKPLRPFASSIRNITQVQTLIEANPVTLPSRYNLVFDDEEVFEN